MWQSTAVIAFRAGLAESIRLLFCRTSGSAVKTGSSTVQSHSYKVNKLSMETLYIYYRAHSYMYIASAVATKHA